MTALAVFGLGALVALAAGIVLWLGVGSAVESTRSLVGERADTVLDALERRLESRLGPIARQAEWIAARFEDRTLDFAGETELDMFIFGALAATPDVAGIGIFRPDGTGRAWYRRVAVAVDEDRSEDPAVREWLRQGEHAAEPGWREPLWLDTLDTAAILHDTPLRREGAFLGMLAQVVPVSVLSQDLAGESAPFTTPFVLHEDRRVLAHPQLMHWKPPTTGQSHPLATLSDIGDPVLAALGTSATREGRWLIHSTAEIEVDWVVLDDEWNLVLRRAAPAYGPWTVGTHINTTKMDDSAPLRLVQAAGAGSAVVVLAVALAIFAGRRFSRPVRAIAAAAGVVEANRLDEVPRLPASAIREMDDANRSFNRMVEGLRERQLIRQTLGRYVPERVAHALLSAGGEIEPTEARASVMFCDLVGFTALTEQLGPDGIVAALNTWFSEMTSIIESREGTVIQFQGDAILASFNVPVPNPEHARNAVEAAMAMQVRTQAMTVGDRRLGCRIGIGTGTVVAGAVGAQGRLSYTAYGDAVNLAARLEALNRELGTWLLVCGETEASATGVALESMGETTVRGQSAATRIYTVGREC